MRLTNFIIASACVIYTQNITAQVVQKDTKNHKSTEKKAPNNKQLILEGQVAELRINLAGSAITDFHLRDNPINPLTWKLEPKDMPKPNQGAPVFQGHFLCVGRWGAASEEEQKKGIPHNGEVNTKTWKVITPPTKRDDVIVAEAVCNMPLERMTVKRTITMPINGSSFVMKEEITNNSVLGRVYNFVQHPTIGAPFLDEQTLIDCNAGLGFDQRTEYDQIEERAFMWPNGKLVDGEVNLRTTTDDRGYVTTHIFDDKVKHGWVTATSPNSGLVLGYVWKTEEYPWINLWHHKKDGKPWAHGLEFGTTGMGKPYKLLTEKNVDFYFHPSLEYIEAGETKTKSYIGFLLKVPKNFSGVSKIEYIKDYLIFHEHGKDNPNKLTLKVGEYLQVK